MSVQAQEEAEEHNTDDWRDTLFYWYGSLQVEEDSEHDSLRIIWAGKQVTLPDCPDARCGATPTKNAFLDSSITFSAEGCVDCKNQKDNRIWKHRGGPLELSMDSGLDHAGEGQNPRVQSNKRKRKTRDAARTLLFNTNTSARAGLVVGKGQNDYGCFVEVGFTSDSTSGFEVPNKMLLVRRYLSDSDERVHWSLTTLKSQVVLGIPPLLGEEGPWNYVLDLVDHNEETTDYPWRSLALHSRTWRQMVLRNQEGFLRKASMDQSEPGPLLMAMPGPFHLRLSPIDFSPNTMWEDQCWGCGGPADMFRLYFTVNEWEWEDWETNGTIDESYSFGEYCSEQCVRNVVPVLARCSLGWKDRNEGKCRFLTTNDDIFWGSLNGEQHEQMENAGWESNHEEEWILRPNQI